MDLLNQNNKQDNRRFLHTREIGGLSVCCLLALAVSFMSLLPGEDIITEENGMTVVNTTTICQEALGFSRQPVPVKIFIKGGKIVKVQPLANRETPKFFAKVKQTMLPKWEGMSVKKAAKADVDGATGATFSSNAVRQNVQQGCIYYNKHKKK